MSMKPVLGLFVVAPFVGEFLLGNLTPGQLWLYPWLMLLYGSGAVLIREIAYRRPSPWAVIPVLGCAYALIEEGPVDQLLWNPGYAGVDLVHTPSYVPFLGTSVGLVVTILGLHAVWSICVSIALVESLTSAGRRSAPWLGSFGLGVVGVLFVCGCALTFFGNYSDSHFLATPFQFGYSFALIFLLVTAALFLGRVPVGGLSASPWMVFGVVLLLTSAWWGPQVLWSSPPSWAEFLFIGVFFVCVALALFVGRRLAWTPVLRFAAAAGAAVTYAWAAFRVVPEGASSPTLLGNLLFSGVLAVLSGAAFVKLHRR
jgi:hypothetical protein